MLSLETTHEGSLGFRIWRQKLPEQMSLPHTHADIELNYLTEGRIHYIAGGRIWDIAHGTLSLFWGGVPHQVIQAEPGSEGIWITFPFAWFARWSVQGAVFRSVLGGMLIQPNESEPRYFRETERARLEVWLDEFDSGDISDRDVLLLELETRVRRMLASPGDESKAKEVKWTGQLRSFQLIAEWIGNHYQERITSTDVADATGYHEKYLMGLFRRITGMTLWAFVRQIRLAHAQRLLVTTDLAVDDIAADAGFGTPRSLYAAFRDFSGDTPAEFRNKTGLKITGI